MVLGDSGAPAVMKVDVAGAAAPGAAAPAATGAAAGADLRPMRANCGPALESLRPKLRPEALRDGKPEIACARLPVALRAASPVSNEPVFFREIDADIVPDTFRDSDPDCLRAIAAATLLEFLRVSVILPWTVGAVVRVHVKFV